MKRTYHVVCRDCRTEHLTASESTASDLSTEHSSQFGHRVAFRQIA
ncbi:hypothetical protein [Haloprofundus marisrubri]|nr:hypothetical protein [Haloprofundus marisrubri]